MRQQGYRDKKNIIKDLCNHCCKYKVSGAIIVLQLIYTCNLKNNMFSSYKLKYLILHKNQLLDIRKIRD